MFWRICLHLPGTMAHVVENMSAVVRNYSYVVENTYVCSC
jgi:hypothetical protein